MTACSHAGMALDAAAAVLWTASFGSLFLHPSPSPRGQIGMVSSRRTCHCHRGGDGSRSVIAEGGRSFIHCLPLQCGGCCSGATPGRPFHSRFLSDYHKHAVRRSIA
ncbi:hypothetical protein CgunFtcFv8_012965 [Champsocephalus gunnari]|uniref:Secreted protein n=1 Tax=Champsocephalus gunnari TaxID=52237 RepID=A0AAN8E0P7_CHAGU|nr:hypothetical protein CgunFtcFv8_012965 [Champsocephalus gunnari]